MYIYAIKIYVRTARDVPTDQCENHHHTARNHASIVCYSCAVADDDAAVPGSLRQKNILRIAVGKCCAADVVAGVWQ